MNLTAYSDSESDGEPPPVPKPASHRIVDRANPGRIKLHLPSAAHPAGGQDGSEQDAPPAKKPRLGAFGGFNAMLPAPKKPATGAPSAGPAATKRALGRGLGAGVNLKTGAEPAFQRESRGELGDYDESGTSIHKEPLSKADFRAMLNLPPSKSETTTQPSSETPTDSLQQEPSQPPRPAAPRFVPLSVGKGKKKAKPTAPRPAIASSADAKEPTTSIRTTALPAIEVVPVAKPRVSLFGLAQETSASVQMPSDNEYHPFFSDTEENTVTDHILEMQPSHHATQSTSAPAPAANDLVNIASELNLSEAERRQLFGKKGRGEPDWSSANIVEFNTDAEYAHNEKLRQLGEQIQHNPLKSFSGTGKNNLRTLVSQATTQKDALEDHFASGHRNKKEAGNRYGW